MNRRLLIVVLTMISLICGIASAQTSSGEIRGRVVDPVDAVISGAKVTLTNQATGDKRFTTTDKEGDFIFLALQPGTFSISVRADNFKASETRGLVLSASDRLSAGVLKLEIGAASETVSVEAQAATIQTESAERSALLDKKEMASLMSIGRDPLSLLRILPGVVNDGAGSSGGLGTQGAGTIAGVRESSNAVSIDGVNGNPRGDGNKLDTPVNMDAVQEVKVVLNSYQAEYGQSAGAIINMTTKSGTQDFHGAAYYYNRNEALNANSWINELKGLPRSRYRYNTMGWNVGGPVYIPKLFNTKKDKLFFFFSQERWPNQGSTTQRFYMPTELEKQGNFSQSYDYNKNKIYVRDPQKAGNCNATDQTACFPGNIIPANRINSNTQAILKVFPTANIDCLPGGVNGKAPCPLTNGTSGDYYNYQITGNTNTPANQTLLRVDYNLNDKWKMYFRGITEAKTNEGLNSTTNKLTWGIPSYYSTPSKNAGLNLTYIASSNLVNEFTVGYSSWNELNGFLNSSDADLVTKSKLGVTLGQNNPAQNPLGILERITGLSSGGSSGTFKLALAPSIDFDNRFPMNNATGTWELTDGLTKVWNNHTAKAGVYFQAGRYIQRHIGSIFSGNFDFSANNASPYDTNYAYSNLMLGSFSSYQEGSNVVNYAPHWNILEFYLQDSWKVRSNLTLSYGVRFTYDLPTQLQSGMGAGFVMDRYASSQVPALYNGVAYNSLNATQKGLCKGTYRTTPTTCAVNPSNPNDVRMDTYIGQFVGSFNYSGMVVNTDPNYPSSLRYSNGIMPAPRFGVSWDPWGNGKTAIRLGAGLYYNTREGGGTVGDYSLIAPLTVNSKLGFGQVAIDGSNFASDCGAKNNCYGSGTPANASPADTRILQDHRKIESTLGVNFGVQQNIGWGTVLDVAYVGTFGRHLNQQLNLNAVPYGGTIGNWDMTNWIAGSYDKAYNCYGAGSSVDKNTGAVTGFCQRKTASDNYVRPYQGYQAINLRDYGATSNYNSLQVTVNRRFAKGLLFGGTYTWSKVLTYMDTVNGAQANFQDRRWWSYGPASFDRSQNFVLHWTANLPKASRLWDNKILKAVADNWEWSGIAQFTTGAPWTIVSTGLPNYTYGGDGTRLFLVGDPYAVKDNVHATGQWLNQAAFAPACAPGMTAGLIASSGCVPVTYQTKVVNGQTYQYLVPDASYANMTRNVSFRGPGIENWDMSLKKNIPIGERVKFTFGAEAYNVFNHPSFTSFANLSSNNLQADYDYGSTGTGKLKSTSVLGKVDGERGARKLQLSARITF